MMRILAIDPGPEESAWLIYDSFGLRPIAQSGIEENDRLLSRLQEEGAGRNYSQNPLVIEMIASYGMPVGKEVFETCVWIGRFIEAWPCFCQRFYRNDIKMHLCGSVRAKDANVRQALIDRFGPGKDKAIGTKKAPGPLYGLKKDLWSALAVAVTADDLEATKRI
jgi:hypothetical protein